MYKERKLKIQNKEKKNRTVSHDELLVYNFW